MSLLPSSPRLPSPPPPTEIQFGPKSPGLGSSSMQESSMEQTIIDTNSKRRIHPGTKAADMAAGPPVVPLSELDSAFQLQEHLKALHYHYSKPSDSESTIPISRETAILIATQPGGVDRALWLYELCRFLINKCNDLIIGFLFDTPPCSATTCPEMRASEWQFLCAVHESPKSCCAIDYCCHTLDWATNIVTSQKIFPSRLSLGAGDAVDDRGAGVKHLTNIFRRLHRIFAHAWFQHRGVFWQVEGQTGLYVLFKTVCDIYDLLPAENYKLPPEAEGLEPVEEPRAPVFSVMKPPGIPSSVLGIEEDFMGASRTNTRRHIRQSPSVGSAVTTVLESEEEEAAADVTQKLRDMQIVEEEGESEIPVIVETFEVDENQDEDERKVDPEVLSHGTIHIQEDPVATNTSAAEEQPLSPHETPDSDKVEEKAAEPEANPESKSEAEPEAEPDSIPVTLLETTADTEPDDEVKELERFSPELVKEDPKPATEDIPHLRIEKAKVEKEEEEEKDEKEKDEKDEIAKEEKGEKDEKVNKKVKEDKPHDDVEATIL